jgi:protein PsiE
MAEVAEKIEESVVNTEKTVDTLGNHLVMSFQYVALFAIGATVVWSAFHSYLGMMAKGVATVDDILLLFIFLELGAMVGIYFQTNRLPVQFLLYVAITVMTRSLASSLSIKDMPDIRLLAITGSILILAVASFVLRYSNFRLEPFISHLKSDDEEVEKSKNN